MSKLMEGGTNLEYVWEEEEGLVVRELRRRIGAE
jgi:hypothetical protein